MATVKTTQDVVCVDQQEYDQCKSEVADAIAASGIAYTQQNDDPSLTITIVFPEKEI